MVNPLGPIINRKSTPKRGVETLGKHEEIDTPLTFPPKFAPFFKPNRYKVAYGGRCGFKSWSIAKALLIMGSQRPLRVLCGREFMSSIADSVHQLLVDKITELHLEHFYEVEKAEIRGKNGTTFRFQGLRNNISQIQSFEGIDIAWIEEAANVSDYSWSKLIPTIRNGRTLKGEAEIWISYNPEFENDSTHQRFVIHPPTGATVVKMNALDCPEWIPSAIKKEMEELKERDPDAYRHIYEGECRKYLEGAVYKHEILKAEEEERFRTVPYDPRTSVQCFFDLGFADSTAIWFVQMVGGELHFIDYYENSQRPIDHYLKVCGEKPYPIEKFWLPHDARAKSLGTGLSVEEIIRGKGKTVKIVPQLSVVDGINAARSIFHQCYFDLKKCGDGIRALRFYKYEVVKQKGDIPTGLRNDPVHDWSSHSADAFRYVAVSMRPQKPRITFHTQQINSNPSNTAWMSV